MKIAVKFCGGCKPDHDRLQTAQRLKDRFGSGVEWVSLENPEAQRTVVIAGCLTACVDLSQIPSGPVHVIAQENDLDRVTAEIRATAGEATGLP